MSIYWLNSAPNIPNKTELESKGYFDIGVTLSVTYIIFTVCDQYLGQIHHSFLFFWKRKLDISTISLTVFNYRAGCVSYEFHTDHFMWNFLYEFHITNLNWKSSKDFNVPLYVLQMTCTLPYMQLTKNSLQVRFIRKFYKLCDLFSQDYNSEHLFLSNKSHVNKAYLVGQCKQVHYCSLIYTFLTKTRNSYILHRFSNLQFPSVSSLPPYMRYTLW